MCVSTKHRQTIKRLDIGYPTDVEPGHLDRVQLIEYMQSMGVEPTHLEPLVLGAVKY